MDQVGLPFLECNYKGTKHVTNYMIPQERGYDVRLWKQLTASDSTPFTTGFQRIF